MFVSKIFHKNIQFYYSFSIALFLTQKRLTNNVKSNCPYIYVYKKTYYKVATKKKTSNLRMFEHNMGIFIRQLLRTARSVISIEVQVIVGTSCLIQ